MGWDSTRPNETRHQARHETWLLPWIIRFISANRSDEASGVHENSFHKIMTLQRATWKSPGSDHYDKSKQIQTFFYPPFFSSSSLIYFPIRIFPFPAINCWVPFIEPNLFVSEDSFFSNRDWDFLCVPFPDLPQDLLQRIQEASIFFSFIREMRLKFSRSFWAEPVEHMVHI